LNAPRRREWKLWHLAALVLASALLFGLLRALADSPQGRILGVLLGAMLASFGVIAARARGRRRRRDDARNLRPPSDLKGWGVRHGGPIGFLAWLLGIGLDLALVVVAVTLVALTIFLLGSWIDSLS